MTENQNRMEPFTDQEEMAVKTKEENSEQDRDTYIGNIHLPIYPHKI